MSAVDIALGVVCHFLLGCSIKALIFPSGRLSDEANIIAFLMMVLGIFGASYFWARVAGFA